MQPRNVAEALAKEWGEMWRPGEASGLRDLLKSMAGKGTQRAITKEDLEKAVRATKGRKAAGIDHWKMEEPRRLPEEAWESFAGILNAAEEQGQWPEAMEGAKIVFLPKGEGDKVLKQRPIGILPMMYRIWARVRLQHAKEEHGSGKRTLSTGG